MGNPATNTANQSSATAFVAAEANKAPVENGKKVDNRKKFVIFLGPETNAQLEAINKVTTVGKINLASEIAKLSIADAYKHLVGVGKIQPVDKTAPVKEAPAAPAAPKG